MRLELTIPDLQSGALAAWRRAQIGTEGEIRTLESSLEDSHVSGYITSACHFRFSIANFRLAQFSRRPFLRIQSMPSQKDQSALGNWQSEMLWNSWQDLNQQP